MFTVLKKMFYLILVFGFASTAYSQLKNNDFSKREQRLSQKRMSVDKVDIKQNTTLVPKRYSTGKWKKPKTYLADKKSSLKVSETRSKVVEDKKILPYTLKQYTRAPQDGKLAPLDKVKRGIESTTVSKYSEAPVVTLDAQRRVLENALKELSLQDINRYSFRRNRSSEPGIPVEQAEDPAP